MVADDLEGFAKRLKTLEAKVAQDGGTDGSVCTRARRPILGLDLFIIPKICYTLFIQRQMHFQPKTKRHYWTINIKGTL